MNHNKLKNMVLELRQTPIDADWNPARNTYNVNQNVSNIAEKIEEQQWPYHLSNDLNNGFTTPISNSQPSNRFQSSTEPPKLQNKNQQATWAVNHNPMVSHHGVISSTSSVFHNFDSSMKMGYDIYNSASIKIPNPQYSGGSSIRNDTIAFDSRRVPPNGLSRSVIHSSSQNFHRQQPFHQGQYRSSSGKERIANNMSFPISVNDVQSFYSSRDNIQPIFQNTQRSNYGTFLQPHGSEIGPRYDFYGLNCNISGSAPISMESRKQKYPFDLPSYESWIGSGLEMIPVQSNGFKIQRLDSWNPAQGRPHVAEGSLSHSCFGLNCNLCGPATNFGMETRKRKYPYEPPSNESGIDSGGTLMDVVKGFLNSSVGDEELLASLSQQPLHSQLPPLVQLSDNSEKDVSVLKTTIDSGSKVNNITTEDAIGNNPISKGSEGNSNLTDNEFKEAPKLSFEEKTSYEMMESSQENPKVICGFNTAADDYETVLESMTPTSILESDKTKTQTTSFDDNNSGSGNIKLPSASLAASFPASQIKEYLSSIIQPNKEIIDEVSQNTCQLCSMDKLSLTPASMYCSSCESWIKQKVVYYWLKDENTKEEHNVCKICFKGSDGCIQLKRGGSVSKTNLKKAENNEEKEDSWVQCDRCQLWQHRICGLYNDETDTEGKAEYVCPKCCLKELEKGTGIPFPKTVWGAKDLPRTNLSDHIEQRLFRRLKQEREETANIHGTELEKVPEAEGLVVRVVVSDDKVLEVRQQFRDIFHGDNYPEKMPYRSKRTGGVDLCIFGMYVQEFGSECDGPNKRSVYISYLDSVKYFQPERKTASTESLRTFVYHEILIGYLEYCKKRGFATCYIYSCPLKKGDEYIFYCHPKTQKTPETKKLLQWYKSMLKKATKDGIVVGITNFYDHFFVPTRDGNSKISAARLPYFEGDSWSEAAINISMELEKEEKSGKLCSKLRSKRILMSTGQDNPTKDALVMQRLSLKILNEKENLIIVRLQHTCTYCHELILSGSRWSCNQCNKIHLCSRCYDSTLLSRNKIHPCHSGKNCLFSEDVLSEVPLDTNDKDDVLVNNFFETREDFLNKCQKSQYHFDKLVHARYSSLMILYRLTRNLSVQPKGDTCLHTHKLTQPSAEVTSEPKNKEPDQKQNVLTLNGALRTLVHASRCQSKDCSLPDCQIIKKLFQHIFGCTARVQNGCDRCQKAWWIVKTHYNICTDSDCRIPRCTVTRKQRETLASSSQKSQDPTNR